MQTIMETKQCPQCGSQFEGRSNKLYCSSKCKMAAFYNHEANEQNGLTIDKQKNEPLTNGLSFNLFEKPLTESQKKNDTVMINVPVAFTINEKDLLEKQSKDCETTLPKLIRIRSLMDETDIRVMQQTIAQQKHQIEELRVKLCFYQSESGKPLNGLLIEMNQKQLDFLTDKFIQSHDFDYPEDYKEELPDGTVTGNQREILEYNERRQPGCTHNCMKQMMLDCLMEYIQGNLVKHCGYKLIEFVNHPLSEKFEKLK